MAEIKTVTATTTESEINFNAFYQYVWLRNLGEQDCYVAGYAGITPQAADVALLKAGENVRITTSTPSVYAKTVSGSTTLEVHAQNFADCPFKVKVKGGDEPVLGTKTVGENGTYYAQDDGYDGYSEFTVEVPPPAPLDDLSVTQNGEYLPTGDYGGFHRVTVNVAQDVEIISRTAWNALTPAQKQAKGLVAIQDSSTGYERGEFVNGADYVQKNRYIPNSDEDDVLCEAYVSNFDATASSWGNGDVPIQYMSPSNKPTLDTTENAVLAAAYSSGVVPYVDLGSAQQSFTAYAVIRQSAAFSQYPRLLSCMYSRLANNGIVLYNNTNEVMVSKWGDELPTSISAVQYFVVAIRNENTSPSTNTTDVYIYNSSQSVVVKKTEEPTNMGQYFTIARTDIDSNTQFAEPSDVYVKYLAVVQGAESESTIGLNMQNIYNEFLAE